MRGPRAKRIAKAIKFMTGVWRRNPVIRIARIPRDEMDVEQLDRERKYRKLKRWGRLRK